ncbi:hypothetical protein BDV93DRAFT_549157, partial [Ceratobasidium sp. AG-I]
MTTYTLSKTSPSNTVLMDPEGNEIYKVSTPYRLGKLETTVSRQGETIATIQWKLFARSTMTMGGTTRPLHEVFPRASKWTTSRIYTTSDGRRLKWKDEAKLYCVNPDTGINLATYYYTAFWGFRKKKSTLDIASDVSDLSDIIVVTWVIAENRARDRRRAQRGAASGASG